MSKLAKAACIVIPWFLTIVSFGMLLIVQLGGSGNSSFLEDIDFTRVQIGNTTFYEIYLWNYCNGTITNGVSSTTYCSARTPGFWFNPYATANLSSPQLMGSAQNAFNSYESAAEWMWIAYMIAVSITAITMVLSIFAIFNRHASFMTFIFAIFAALFTTMSTITSTIVFTVLANSITNTLGKFSITASTSDTTLGLTWASTVLLNIAALFYTIFAFSFQPPSTTLRLESAYSDTSTLPDKEKANDDNPSGIRRKLSRQQGKNRESGFDFIDAAPTRPRDSFMSRISEGLSPAPGRQGSTATTHARSASDRTFTLSPAPPRRHLSSDNQDQGEADRPRVSFAMDRTRYSTYSAPSPVSPPHSPGAMSPQQQQQRYLPGHLYPDHEGEMVDIMSPIWGEGVDKRVSNSSSSSESHRNKLVTQSIAAGPWARTGSKNQSSRRSMSRSRSRSQSKSPDGAVGREYR